MARLLAVYDNLLRQLLLPLSHTKRQSFAEQFKKHTANTIMFLYTTGRLDKETFMPQKPRDLVSDAWLEYMGKQYNANLKSNYELNYDLTPLTDPGFLVDTESTLMVPYQFQLSNMQINIMWKHYREATKGQDREEEKFQEILRKTRDHYSLAYICRGSFLSVPPNLFSDLQPLFKDRICEVFSSPINSYFKYCSLYKYEEEYLGSCGVYPNIDIEKIFPGNEPALLICNPPFFAGYIRHVIEKTSEWIKKYPHLVVVIIGPIDVTNQSTEEQNNDKIWKATHIMMPNCKHMHWTQSGYLEIRSDCINHAAMRGIIPYGTKFIYNSTTITPKQNALFYDYFKDVLSDPVTHVKITIRSQIPIENYGFGSEYIKNRWERISAGHLPAFPRTID